jgi:membrane-associated phospholipid phosphatase
MLVAIVIQGTIKHAAHKSRPYWADSGVEAIECHSSTFGFPSGHSMAPTATLGWFAYEMTRRYLGKRSTSPNHWWGVALIWLVVILYSLTVGLSRSYLGVHYLRGQKERGNTLEGEERFQRGTDREAERETA